MEDLDAMFGGDAEAVDVPAIDPVVEQEASVEQPVSEPVIEQPVEPKPQVPEGYVPLAVVKELRDEIRSLKTAPVQQPMPQDNLYPDEDTLAVVNQKLRQQAMQFSQMQAEEKFGAETVQTAFDWAYERCNTDPAFNLAVAQSPHPYKFIVEEHRRNLSLQELGSIDPEQVRQFKQWQAAQQQLTPQPAPAVSVAPAATPPRSIASQTSAGEAKPPKVSPEEERLAKMF
ncbi:hypothetical protein UFOVP319_44 [uncultured Caudovirales phage]|uniref:Uncharacterized protein n=1 Tax=uncultured Caudovirales phage TaxID=2100421 RepID=A0A6J5LWP8_9CAUD|nr:hypothetical protein UFOVP319_44 [uncultured Caudovirales phage]